MQDNNTPDNNTPSNPFQLNLDQIKSSDEENAQPPMEPVQQQPVAPPQHVQPPMEPVQQQPVVPQQPVQAPVEPVQQQPVAPPQPVQPPVGPVQQPMSGTVAAAAAIPMQEKSVFSQPTITLLIAGPILLAILAFSYWETLVGLVRTWETVVDYHHGFFVVPFVVYFLWCRRDSLPRQGGKTDALAGIIIGGAVLLFWSFFRYRIMIFSMVTLDSWTLLVWIWAVTLMCFGVRVFLWALPSLIFLAFMFPWPPTIEMQLRGPLQGFAAQLSVYMLRLVGEPAIAQANIVLMSNGQRLDVAAACSGIRVLVSVIAAAYAAMLLMRRPWWQNVLLFCLVIPVALLVNALRIAMTGLLIKYASGLVEKFGSEKPVPVVCDEISGGIMLVLTFVLFVVIVWWISKVFQRVEIPAEPARLDQI